MGAATARAGRYLSFVLGGDTYAVPVERVEVVLEEQVVTRVPNAEPYLRGVFNHRGSVVPVIDPRIRFGQASRDGEAGSAHSMIVMQLEYDGESTTVGMLADGVREVIDISSIKPAPAIGSKAGEGFLSGVADGVASDDVPGGFIVVLDVDAAFARVAGKAEEGPP